MDQKKIKALAENDSANTQVQLLAEIALMLHAIFDMLVLAEIKRNEAGKAKR